jgi:GTPase SAR1 family protein
VKIIVVGMDNTGKTTLCKTLASKLNAVHAKPLGPGRSREDMFENIIHYMDMKETVIFERFSIFEELIYGKILRKNSKFDFKDVEMIRHYHPVIVYCRPPKEVILNFGDRAQMPGVIEKSERLIKEWDHLIYDCISGFKIITYDWTKDKLGDILTGGVK